MHIRIGICDDEREICTQLEEMLEEEFRKRQIEIVIETYQTCEDLCKDLQKDGFDLLFLDIELPKMNGVELGDFIREQLENEAIQIVYISAKESYAMELFRIRPLNFLVKPIGQDEIGKIIDKYLVVTKHNHCVFIYKKGRDFIHVPMSEILYFACSNRKVVIVSTKGKDEYYDSMDMIYSQVKSYRFLYIHQSYIINYNFVARFGYEEVEMVNGDLLPISQSRRKAVREKHKRLMEEERG